MEPIYRVWIHGWDRMGGTVSERGRGKMSWVMDELEGFLASHHYEAGSCFVAERMHPEDDRAVGMLLKAFHPRMHEKRLVEEIQHGHTQGNGR